MTSAFKEAVAKDIHDVFLNEEEFAYEHTINDVTLKCVIDTVLTQASGQPQIGVFVNQIRIHLPVGTIRKPVEDEQIFVDGEMLLVRSVSEEMGMLVITAERNMQ